jgi:DNA (cytosine-5)-methyltransferase 1
LNSTTHGNIPQNRERTFIVGFLNSTQANAFEFPSAIPLTKNFRDYLVKDVESKYFYLEGRNKLYDRIKEEVTSEDCVYQWRRHYVRVNKKGVVPTLTANMGSGGHNVPIIKTPQGLRRLTPMECFRLQGFPEWYSLPNLSDSELYHQAGNSVTVPVICRIAKNMATAMGKDFQ